MACSLQVMVAIAPSRVGFPLHAHGRSWMALVAGHKLWALWDPEQSPAAAEPSLAALTVSWDGWLRQAWDRLGWTEKPPTLCVQVTAPSLPVAALYACLAVTRSWRSLRPVPPALAL